MYVYTQRGCWETYHCCPNPISFQRNANGDAVLSWNLNSNESNLKLCLIWDSKRIQHFNANKTLWWIIPKCEWLGGTVVHGFASHASHFFCSRTLASSFGFSTGGLGFILRFEPTDFFAFALLFYFHFFSKEFLGALLGVSLLLSPFVCWDNGKKKSKWRWRVFFLLGILMVRGNVKELC